MAGEFKMKTKRPFLLWLLVIIFLISSFVSISGVVATLKTWNWFQAFSPAISPIYNIFKGSFLTLAWLAAAILLWLRITWSVTYSISIAALTAAWFWVDRVLLSQNPLPLNRHILPILITIILFTLILFSLYSLLPYMKQLPSTGEEIE
jgi:hypothetical protein